MIVVGGTYTEICFEPIWENIYGSGFRAVDLILQNSDFESVEFHTCGDEEIKAHLHYFQRLNPSLQNNITDISKSPEFHYDHPLRTPMIVPRSDLFSENKPELNVEGKNILFFGLLEASVSVKGSKVVYDPQSPANPISFSDTGSIADDLITIINIGEAKKLTGLLELGDIVDYFFNSEKCSAIIIKMGAKGALLFQPTKKEPVRIPVFKTNSVWTIGSGDVFSAFFAMNWFKGQDIESSAILASKATALYCDSKDLSIFDRLKNFSNEKLVIDKVPNGQIYLAGPFFTFSERWLINEVWNTFKSIGLKVFSPFHDVGHGKAKDVVDKDLQGLDESEIVFAVIDGLDSGTLFEVGYAICQKKKVIAFVQKEGEESIKMLEGTHCIIERDFTTAIYKLYWELAKK